MKLELFYKDINNDPDYKQLLGQIHWFVSNAVFDPITGSPLPQKLTTFLKRIDKSSNDDNEIIKDRIWRIADHSRNAIKALLLELKENPMRDHASLPIGKVKELDVSSFIKLCNRPGRNIREKCAGRPYMQAPRHFLSHNLPENQLFKAFVSKLSELLILKSKSLNEQEDELVPLIQKWLHSDVAEEITRWNNLPPNNTLLSHRYYRRILDGWHWLSELEKKLENDLLHLEEQSKNISFWNHLAKLVRYNDIYIAEEPVEFNYSNLSMDTWSNFINFYADKPYSIPLKPSLLTPEKSVAIPKIVTKGKTKKTKNNLKITVPVCIDLTSTCPVYASTELNEKQSLDYKLIFQLWKLDKEERRLYIADSDAIWLNDKNKYLSSSDLFYSSKKLSVSTDIIAKRFIGDLKNYFENQSLMWLIPDIINDFELKELRVAINNEYHAEPLPRSVAAVFEQLDFKNKKIKDNYSILVVDYDTPVHTLTKIIVKYSDDLLKQNKETNGFYLERHPCIVLESNNYNSEYYLQKDIKVLKNGKWFIESDEQSTDITHEQLADLCKKHELGKIDLCIVIDGSPVLGGIRLLKLQKPSDKYPYWKDSLPELSTKIPLNGYYQHFYFVDKDTKVSSVRGKSTLIPINNTFTLSAKQKSYSFQLFQGMGKSSLKFIARLNSRDFPIKEEINCRLKMEYTYGASNPYKLTFVPINSTLKPIVAEWEELKPRIIDSMPSMPNCKTWYEFEHFPKKDNPDELNNLLEWVERKISVLDYNAYKKELLEKTINKYKLGKLVRPIRKDRLGNDIALVKIEGIEEEIFCPAININPLQNINFYSLPIGQKVYLRIDKKGKGRNLIFADYITDDIKRLIGEIIFNKYNVNNEFEYINNNSDYIYKTLKSARFPLLTIWNNGHSLSEYEVPDKFRQIMLNAINSAKILLKNEYISERLKYEIIYFLSCLHRDAPVELHDELNKIIDSPQLLNSYINPVGFVIGDASMPWQKELLRKIIDNVLNSDFNLEQFKSSLRILAISIWRNISIVEMIKKGDLISISKTISSFLYNELKSDKSLKRKCRANEKNELRQSITSSLEILLALITLRNSKDYELKELFMPGNKLTTDIVNSLDTLTEKMINSNIKPDSRFVLKMEKPMYLNKTDDLIYALRTYLSGDDGASSISISSINDSEE